MVIQVENSESKLFKVKVSCILVFFSSFGSLHIHNVCGWDSSLNMKSICVSYTAYTHNLMVISYNTVIHIVQETKFVYTEPSES